MFINLMNLLKRFKKEDRGSMTVEFVIIVPMLIIWWMGSVVFFDAYKARASATRVAHTIADIMSRQTETTNAFIDSLLVLQDRMMQKSTSGVVRISDITLELDDTYTVSWSYSTGGISLLAADIPTSQIPTMAAGQHILLVQTSVPYNPIADWVGLSASTLTNSVFTNARFVDSVPNTSP